MAYKPRENTYKLRGIKPTAKRFLHGLMHVTGSRRLNCYVISAGRRHGGQGKKGFPLPAVSGAVLYADVDIPANSRVDRKLHGSSVKHVCQAC